MEFDSMTSVAVVVGTGVMGENIRGFGVAVGCEAGAEAGVGNVPIGSLTAESASADTDTGVASEVQEDRNIQTVKTNMTTRFIEASIPGEN
jgi:hypothetical protein